jgi:NitT/TauT family transport system substrate-binding protein
MKPGLLLLVCYLLLGFGSAESAEEKRLQPLNIAYDGFTVNRAPLWLAKDLGLFEKHGLDVNLIRISPSVIGISALIAGDIQIISVASSTAIAAAARGASVCIIATSGAIDYQLIARASITNKDQLKGKILGSSRPGASSDYVLRLLLPKLGLVPGKDVTIVPTGFVESERRVQLILQGKIDATVGNRMNVLNFGLSGYKFNILANPLEFGVYGGSVVLATTREFLKNQPGTAKAFLMANIEALRLAKSNKQVTFQILRKYMKVEDPILLDAMHNYYILGLMPVKPYPREEEIRADMNYLSGSISQIKDAKPSDFLDTNILQDLEKEGFFGTIQR